MKLLFLFWLLALSCTKSSDPENVLKQYFSIIKKSDVEKSDIVALTSGSFKSTIESLSEEEFNSLKQLEGSGSVKLKVKNKRCDKSRCFLTYEVVRQDSSEQFEEVSKKIIEMVQEDGAWRIVDISNVKSYVELLNTIKIGN